MNGITYDNPLTLSYHFNQINFAATVTRLLPVPILKNGRKPGGKIIGASLMNITTDFAGSTSDAQIQVGITGDLDKYYKSQALDETVDIGEVLFLRNVEPTAVDIEAGRTDITVTFVGAVGTPTGVSDVVLHVAWY